MDAKITKKRLNIFLSYDWIKIVLLVVAAIVLWSLIFTTSATRVTPAQNFTIFNYMGTSATSRFNSYPDILRQKEVFSYDILEVTATDVTTGEKYGDTLLQTRVSTGDGDAIFAANVSDGVTTEYEDDKGEKFKPTYLEQFLYGYYGTAASFGEGGYIDQMTEYLNGYYHGDYRTGELDKDKVLSDFHTRIKSLKDKRFKTDAKLKKGEEAELARIEGYRRDLLDFLSYLDEGYIALQETTLYMQDANGNKVTKTDYFSINLCPTDDMEKLKEDVYYRTEATDENGATQSVATARDVNIVLMNVSESKYDYNRWEGLSFVNYLVQTHSKSLNA